MCRIYIYIYIYIYVYIYIYCVCVSRQFGFGAIYDHTKHMVRNEKKKKRKNKERVASGGGEFRWSRMCGQRRLSVPSCVWTGRDGKAQQNREVIKKQGAEQSRAEQCLTWQG